MSRSKLKIAIFHNLRSGGARRTVIEFGKRLAKKHRVDVYSLDPRSKKDLIFAKKIEVFPFKLHKNFLFAQKKIIFDLPRIHEKIAEEIDNLNYDVVYVDHDIFTKAPYILRFLKTPSVYFCHEPPREFYETFSLFSTTLKLKIINLLRYYLKFIDKRNVAGADVIISSSDYSKIRNSKIYNRQVKRTRSGVDTDVFKYLKKKREKFFLTVGALALFKGYNLLIKSISLLPRQYQYPLIVIAPHKEGRDKKYIKKLAKRYNVILKIKNINSDKELVDYYNRARLCLFTPVYEPFGLIPLEAMACGLPVVGVKEGGLVETIITGKGWITPRNPHKFSQAIIKALETELTTKKSLELRNYVKEKWNWDYGAKQLEKILLETSKK